MLTYVADVADTLLVDADGTSGRYRLDRNCRFEVVDRDAERLLGMPATELLQRCIWDIVPSLRGSELQRRYAALLDGAGAQHFLFHHVPLDRWYAVAADPLGAAEYPEAVDIRFREASADQAMAARIAAERLDAAAQVAGRLAHDFNNCLTVILGNTEYLTEVLADRPELAEVVGLIAEAGDRAAALTSRILQFAQHRRPAAGKVDVGALLEPLAARLRAEAPAWPVEVSIESSLPPALIDAAGLEAALRELVANARDAMPGGGLVRLGVERASRRDRLRICVADHGPGLAPDLLQRCREPFVSTKSERWGVGLGLSAAHGFAVSHGGALLLEQQPGPGLCATLELPAALPKPAGPPAAAGHVLMVEDDAANRIGIAGMLTTLGYIVTTAATAADALQALRTTLPDTLLLADVVLPGDLDGARLVKEARRLRPALPALLMSGYAARLSGGEAARVGGVRLLAKPFRRADLERALSDSMAESTAQDPFADP